MRVEASCISSEHFLILMQKSEGREGAQEAASRSFQCRCWVHPAVHVSEVCMSSSPFPHSIHKSQRPEGIQVSLKSLQTAQYTARKTTFHFNSGATRPRTPQTLTPNAHPDDDNAPNHPTTPPSPPQPSSSSPLPAISHNPISHPGAYIPSSSLSFFSSALFSSFSLSSTLH
jgi:hypothetical protein